MEMRKELKSCFVLLFAVIATVSLFAGEKKPVRASRPAARSVRAKTPQAVTNEFGHYLPPKALQRPYVAVNYSSSIIAPGEKAVIPVYMTDFYNNYARNDDQSQRLSVTITLSRIEMPKTIEEMETEAAAPKAEEPAKTASKTRTTGWRSGARKAETARTGGDTLTIRPKELQGVHPGDYTAELPALTEGLWRLGVWCVDQEGRRSHTVWHEILCREPKLHAETIAKATKVLTAADILAKGGVAEQEGLSKVVGKFIDTTGKKGGAELDNFLRTELEAVAQKEPPPEGGYTVYAGALEDGRIRPWAYAHRVIVRSPSRDEEAVAAQAVKTREALQTLIDEAAEAGVRRLVLPKGIYRIAHGASLKMRSGLTLDLNGSVIKLNGFAGHSNTMVSFTDTHDAHLVNGVLEGDYYEHDYASSDKNSEWVHGVIMSGDCRWTTVENVTMRNITGYGAGNGANHTFKDECHPLYVQGGAKWQQGAVDLETGELVPGEICQYTTKLIDISKFKSGKIAFSRYLGYQGMSTRAWTYTLAFYDAEEKFLGGDVAYLYRKSPIPKGARFVRATVEALSEKEAGEASLFATSFRLPENCAFLSNRFERCRCVGLAPSAMLNMRIEGNEFLESGETSAKCAFDAEDGWDMMQDVLVKGNRFHHNPNNELLLCAGHDFLIEGNECRLYLWDRVQSACIRGNKFSSAHYGAGDRNCSMFGRFLDNEYGKSLSVGGGRGQDGVMVLRGITFGSSETNSPLFSISLGKNVTISDCTLRRCAIGAGGYRKCRFEDCKMTISGPFNRFEDCDFEKGSFQHLRATNEFARCSFKNLRFDHIGGATVRFMNSRFTDVGIYPGFWMPPSDMTFTGCTIDNGGRNEFYGPAIYAMGDILFDKCEFTGGKHLVSIGDLRASKTDDRPARLMIRDLKQTTANGAPVVNIPMNAPGGTKKKLQLVAKNLKLAPGVVFIDPKQVKTDKDDRFARLGWTLKTR